MTNSKRKLGKAQRRSTLFMIDYYQKMDKISLSQKEELEKMIERIKKDDCKVEAKK